MGLACQVVAGRVTNPGATVSALTANTGDSFTVANFPVSAPAYLDQMWAKEATPGVFRIRSPRLHDVSQALRFQVGSTAPRLLMPTYADQNLYPADTLTVELSGGGAEVDNGFFLAYYTDLPGVNARLAAWSEISGRIRNITGTEVDLTTSATAGQWSAGTPINATFDNLKANTDYAILGYTSTLSAGAIAVAGPDTGNYRIGGPGNIDQIQTNSFFIDMASETGRPYIPIFNSNNKGGTLCYVADPSVSNAANVSFTLAELST